MKKRIKKLAAVLSLSCLGLAGGAAFAVEFELLDKFSVNGYTVLRGSADIPGGSFTVGGSTFVVKNGNVGIGITAPGYKLDVNGGVRITDGNLIKLYTGGGGSDDYTLRAITSGAYPVALALANDGTINRYFQIGYYDTGAFQPKFVVNSYTGDVGIGTAGPGYKLEVNGDIKLTGDHVLNRFFRAEEVGVAGNKSGISFGATAQKGAIYGASGIAGIRIIGGPGQPVDIGSSVSNSIDHTDFTSRLFVNSNGNIGIGTQGPGEKLEISAGNIGLLTPTYTAGTADVAAITHKGLNGAASGLMYPDAQIVFGKVNGFDTDWVHGAYISFKTTANNRDNAPSEKLRIDQNGNIGIGTAGPLAPLDIFKAVSGAGYYGVPSGGLILSRYVSGSEGSDTRGSSIFHSYRSNSGDYEYLAFAVAGPSQGTPYAAGNVKMVIDQGGNVGIGTAAPAQKLEVNGNALINGNLIQVNNSATPELYLNKVGTRGWSARNDGAFKIFNWEDSSNPFTIINGGNVGIGTVNPAYPLHVNGTAGAGYGDELGWRQFSLGYSWDGASMHYYWNRVFQIATGSNVIFQVLVKTDYNYADYGLYNIQVSNYAGVSVSIENDRVSGRTPVYVAVDNSGYVWIKGIGAWQSSFNYKVIRLDNVTVLSGASVTTQESDPGSLVVNPSQYVRATLPGLSKDSSNSGFSDIVVNTSGNIGIGTTNPGAPLEVNSASTQLRLKNPESLYAGSYWKIGPDGNNSIIIYNQNNHGVWIGNDGITWESSSDKRLKTDIKPLDSATLHNIGLLNPVTFKWRDKQSEANTHVGFIAQEMQKVFPLLVSTGPPTALTPDGTLSVDYTGLTPYLVKAVQELKADSDKQRTEIERLKSELETLKKQP